MSNQTIWVTSGDGKPKHLIIQELKDDQYAMDKKFCSYINIDSRMVAEQIPFPAPDVPQVKDFIKQGSLNIVNIANPQKKLDDFLAKVDKERKARQVKVDENDLVLRSVVKNLSTAVKATKADLEAKQAKDK